MQRSRWSAPALLGRLANFNCVCCGFVADAGRVLSLTELQTLISGQSSVPVTETALKDALRALAGEVSVNWSNQTVQAVSAEA